MGFAFRSDVRHSSARVRELVSEQAGRASAAVLDHRRPSCRNIRLVWLTQGETGPSDCPLLLRDEPLAAGAKIVPGKRYGLK